MSYGDEEPLILIRNRICHNHVSKNDEEAAMARTAGGGTDLAWAP